SLKTSIKTITYLSDIGCLEIQGASLGIFLNMFTSYKEIQIKLLSACGGECTDRPIRKGQTRTRLQKPCP
nr:hypothetical protein [Escherichia coli]